MKRELNLDNPVGHGAVLLEEGRVLTALAAAHGGPVLEIGACQGWSTKFILNGLPDNALVVSVDPNHQGRWSDLRLKRWTCYSDKIEQHPDLCQFKWAFIDGNHCDPWPVHDLNLVQRLGVAFAVFHDSLPIHWPDVQAALDASNLPYTELNTPCGLAIIRFKETP